MKKISSCVLTLLLAFNVVTINTGASGYGYSLDSFESKALQEAVKPYDINKDGFIGSNELRYIKKLSIDNLDTDEGLQYLEDLEELTLNNFGSDDGELVIPSTVTMIKIADSPLLTTIRSSKEHYGENKLLEYEPFINSLHIENCKNVKVIDLYNVKNFEFEYEDFKELNELYLKNILTIDKVDLRQNKKLEKVSIQATTIKELLLPDSQTIEELILPYNNIQFIDLANQKKLKKLDLRKNHITELDFKDCTSLESLQLYDNHLTYIDLSKTNVNSFGYCVQNVELNTNKAEINIKDINELLKPENVIKVIGCTYENGIFKNSNSNLFVFEYKINDKYTMEVRIKLNSNKFNYSDVESKDWFYSSVEKAHNKGLMSHTGKGEWIFEPDAPITRGMVATVLHRMAGNPKVTFKATFIDVKQGVWYSNAIIWAAENKVVSGNKDGSYAPDKEITRQDLAIMLRNYAKSKGVDTTKVADLKPFLDDESVDSYASSAIAWCVEAKLMSGAKTDEGSKLNPKANASRAECAKMFSLLDDLIKAN